jgi:phosphopantothenoylcysteine decarboxylase / phosphopantothenate---cysteine ligase
MKNNRPPASGEKNDRELEGRKILVGISGGIAAYKTVELVRALLKAGARVQVVMTKAATKFITPLTFETITGRNVFVEMFPPHGDISPWHTEMASWPDLAVIAPATANHMARLAAGIADDLLTTIMLTLERPRLLCPSMNHRMWANPATQDNLATLKRRGYRFVMPEEGQMARPGEDEGMGRLADPAVIYREIRHILSAPQDLRGVRILVTAGRTEESWDPVRMLTNRASGRMGFALAEEARERGADVMLVHGPTDVIPPPGVQVRRVVTAAEMATAVKQEFAAARIVLMAAALADYTFPRTIEHKIKKGDPNPEVNLVPTEDILRSLSGKKGDRVIVGFALETENLLENSLRKLREKHLDIVVANNPLAPGAGFAGETNQVLIIHRSGRVNELPLQSKREVAREILNAVIQIYRHPEPEPEPEPEMTEIESAEALLDEDIDFTPLTEVETTPVSDEERKRKNRRRGGRRNKGGKNIPAAVESAVGIKPPIVEAPAVVPPSAPVKSDPESAETPELPFPTAGGGSKRSRGRRGGRRAQRARARKAAQQTGEPPIAALAEPKSVVPESAKTETPKKKRASGGKPPVPKSKKPSPGRGKK